MVDKITKALTKLTPKKKEILKDILLKIKQGNLKGLDLKKLKGRNDVFRVRTGDHRIIFYKNSEKIRILTLEKRSDNTYN